MIKVCIVEDEPALLEFLSLLIDSEHDFSVIGSFKTAEESLELFKQTEPDILVTDLFFGEECRGIWLIEQVKKLHPNVLSIALTSYDSGDFIENSLVAGACGYLLKTDSHSNICQLLRSAMQGDLPLSPKATTFLVNRLRISGSMENDIITLTKRERDILTYLDNGLTYKQIADKCCVSLSTIQNQTQSLYKKLDVHKSIEAIHKAKKQGLI